MLSTTVDMFSDGTEIERRVLKFIGGRKSQDDEFYKKCVNRCPSVKRNEI